MYALVENIHCLLSVSAITVFTTLDENTVFLLKIACILSVSVLSLIGSVAPTLTQEVMMRKKNALHLDGRYNTMIENAFYYCNPPEYRREDTRRQRPPQHEYIRRLLYRDLNKVTTEKVTGLT